MVHNFLRGALLVVTSIALVGVFPHSAQAISMVDLSKKKVVHVFQVQFKHPKTGAWTKYRDCFNNTEIVNAVFELTRSHHTVRYIDLGMKTYVWTYKPGFYSLGQFEEYNGPPIP
jgi:hypothetical protein